MRLNRLIMISRIYSGIYLILFIIPFILILDDFYNKKNFFLIFIIFWSVFSIKFDIYSYLHKYKIVAHIGYIKVYTFIFFIIYYLTTKLKKIT